MKIKVMDEILANKIAAGEVVERCASVVKELVENSIDAGSDDIKIELLESGVKLIKVTDNGSGMEKEDAILAFNRHATSKIDNEDDLYHINTLGFRGEALASIASVSNVLLKTSTGNIGTIVNIKGGKVLSVENGDSRKGTIIEVKELFYNTPARLKHMKSLYTELSSITEYINKLSLSRPDIRFTLINNNNLLLKTDGSNLLKTISSIYGMDITKKMLDINGEDDDYVINGYISLPEVHRSNRNHIITIVNGRVVRNMDLNRVINESYHSYKPDNRYPIVIINIDVDSSLIDVNIHPTKQDIKFSKLEELLNLINMIIKEKLKKQVLISSSIIEERIPLTDVIKQDEVLEKPLIDVMEQEIVLEKPRYEEQVLDFDLIEEEQPIYNEIERLPLLYPVGLVHGTYIICQNEEGMYILDQHAAKERINYELFKNKLNNPSKEHTLLLLPITIELTNSEYIIIKENFDFLNNMGLIVEEFGINSIIVKAHPVWLTTGFEDLQIRKIIEIVINKEKDFSIDKFNDQLATTLACKASIKANTNISLSEMEGLINDLRKCDNPFNCPHGRPTIIQYSKYDLERLFKRSGFDQIK